MNFILRPELAQRESYFKFNTALLLTGKAVFVCTFIRFPATALFLKFSQLLHSAIAGDDVNM